MNEAQSRSPDELERDIARTRAAIDRTLTILQDKVSPAAVVDRALRSTREGGAEFASSVGRTARDNPVPLALLGISLGWLMLSNRDRGYQREAVRNHGNGSRGPKPSIRNIYLHGRNHRHCVDRISDARFVVWWR